MRGRQTLLPLLLAGLGLAGCRTAAPAGTWQGRPWAPATAAPATPANQPRLLILDTGGSGGSFGQGDIRQALHDVHFWDDRRGWACGYGGVFRSADGGLTWDRALPKGGWYQLEVSGPEEVWLLEGQHPGGPGKVWLRHSADGGRTWTEVAPGTFAGYQDLYCRGPQRWILCGGYGTWRSRDGGTTWTRQNIPLQGYRIAIPADAPNEQGEASIYLLGIWQKQRRLLRSDDDGQTWRVLPLPAAAQTEGGHRDRLYFADSQCGWLGGNGNQLWQTRDGGETWEARTLPTDQGVAALWCNLAGGGLVAVQNSDFLHPRQALYYSSDNGATWQALCGGAKTIAAFWGRGPRHWWAVGNVPGFIVNDLVIIGTP